METQPRSIVPLPVFIAVILLLVACVAAGAVFYHLVEGLSPVDAIYFASMTMTTVGYGDFVPKTDIGKMFTALYAFVGIGIFFGFAAVIFQGTLGRMQKLHKSFKDSRDK